MLDCCFCSELREGTSPDLVARYGSRSVDRVVWKSRNLAVIPTIGQIKRGHSLILTLSHVNSFAALQASTHPRVEREVRNVMMTLERALGPCVMFEHGTPEGATEGSCGIVHAHLHVVPVGEVRLGLPDVTHVDWIPLAQQDWLKQIGELGGRGEGYLLVWLPTTGIATAIGADAPSQFLRRWVANGLGSRAWDWRTSGDDPALQPTIEWMRKQIPPPAFAATTQARALAGSPLTFVG